ncbi:MAG: polyprenyl synthetase family protein [bacterium]
MRKNESALAIFSVYTAKVDEAMKKVLSTMPDYAMYGMMRYFLGFANEKLQPVEAYAGKRFRPGLCLLFADILKDKKDVLDFAVAIELFHNFTLIHDDIEDQDPLRRDRPTVWKLWGINHGINTGDGQLALTNLVLAQAVKKHPNVGLEAQIFLNQIFLRVIEGQFLDFTLAELSLSDNFVNTENVLKMIGNKTSVLVGASCQLPGVIAGLKPADQQALWGYGFNLGLAYQLYDDYVSIWASEEETGKIVLNDLYEKKKTLPVLFAYSKLTGEDKERFEKIYQKTERLIDGEVEFVKKCLDQTRADDYIRGQIILYALKAKQALCCTKLLGDNRETLQNIVDELMPRIKNSK